MLFFVATIKTGIASDSDIEHVVNDSEFSERSHLSQAEIDQCQKVMESLRRWREADRALSEVSRRYVRLNESDMRTIRMLIRAQQRGRVVTPKDIAREVGISSASTTKLVRRLEVNGHLVRVAHPSDRRTICLEVTAATARVARETIGRQHSRRFDAAAALDGVERETVIRFLTALAEADSPQGYLAEASDSAKQETVETEQESDTCALE
ncbi:MarR family transcriptional regulator [Brevibacterium aurantiacum]|nr:MarR family transcriptional regulator [Brevibacterium aurantiacum]